MQGKTATHTPHRDRKGKLNGIRRREKGPTTHQQHIMWSGRHRLVPSILLVLVIQSQPPPYLPRLQHGRDVRGLPCSSTSLCVCVWASASLDTTARMSSDSWRSLVENSSCILPDWWEHRISTTGLFYSVFLSILKFNTLQLGHPL